MHEKPFVGPKTNIQELFHVHTASLDSNSGDKTSWTCIDVEQALTTVEENVKQADLLTKPRATDVIVYMLCDMDRMKRNNESLLALPVYYGLAGKSISIPTLRSLTADVIRKVKLHGLHIVAKGFDGQMYKMAVQDDNEKCLTLLQQQKKLWQMESSKPKANITSEITERVTSATGAEAKEPEKETGWSPSILPLFENLSNQTEKDLRQLDHSLVQAVQSSCSTFRQSQEQILQRTGHLKRQLSQRVWPNTPDQDDVHVKDTVFEEFDLLDDDLVTDFITELEMEMANMQCDGTSKEPEELVELNDDDLKNLFAVDEQVDRYQEAFPLNRIDENMPVHHRLTDDDIEMTLASLKTSSEKMQKKWGQTSVQTFSCMFESAATINANFTLVELRECYKAVKGKLAANKKPHYMADFVNIFSDALGDSRKIPTKEKDSKPIEIPSLRSLLNSNIKKNQLLLILCTLKWPETIAMWKEEAVITDECKVVGLNEPGQWYTQPEMFDGEPLYSFIDFHHLLTNTRCHIARHGYPDAGIDREAWLTVARKEKENMTGLNIAFVDDVIDPQNNSVAKTFFSHEVEDVMRGNGDLNEASFCHEIRSWYEALDTRGIPSMHRIEKLLSFRSWLLKLLNPILTQFPPPGSRIASIPIQNFEGLLISTERVIQLYLSVRKASYNVRALGYQMSETFFSGFRDLDPRGAGVLRPSELPRAFGMSCQIMETRLDPNR